MSDKCVCRSLSDDKMNKQSCDFFETVATRIKDRYCGLMGRHNTLRDKITTMERSIPALMAYNMFMNDQDCRDSAYCKIREIMNKLYPCLDPTDRLLDELNCTVKKLSEETAELHEKIINADVELEETDMELESIKLANKEMSEELKQLEQQVICQGTPSLHSVHSEDLVCLKRIHQLAKEELWMKNCIAELEEKEMLFRDQLDRLLTSKEFEQATGTNKLVERIRELECNEKRMHCALRSHKQNMLLLRKKLAQKDKELVKTDMIDANWEKSKVNEFSDTTMAWDTPQNDDQFDSRECICPFVTGPKLVTCYEKSRKSKGKKSARQSKEIPSSQPPCKTCAHSHLPKSKPCAPPSCCIPLPTPQSKTCKPCPPPPCSKVLKMKTPCSNSPLCEPPPCIGSDPQGVKKDKCRCNCRGKCSRGLSGVPCNCGVTPKCPKDKGYQPIATKLMKDRADDSDDEFCECCSCEDEDSASSVPCQCN